VPQIEVTFDIDANGILNVSARDKATGKEQRITITASSGLSKEEVERLVKEAEAHAEEDRRKRQEIETRNLADSLAYNAEKTLREHADKIPADLKSEVEGKVSQLRSALQSNDIQRIRRAMEELQVSLQRIGSTVYSQAGRGQSGPQGRQEGKRPPEDGGTVEGEYREV